MVYNSNMTTKQFRRLLRQTIKSGTKKLTPVQ